MFTFGAGGYGQLGHNSTSHEINPRKVFELMGNVVTQIACGRLAKTATSSVSVCQCLSCLKVKGQGFEDIT